MDDTQKLLKTIILNQNNFKNELITEIRTVNIRLQGVGKLFDSNFNMINKKFEKIQIKLDKLIQKSEKISKKFAVA